MSMFSRDDAKPPVEAPEAYAPGAPSVRPPIRHERTERVIAELEHELAANPQTTHAIEAITEETNVQRAAKLVAVFTFDQTVKMAEALLPEGTPDADKDTATMMLARRISAWSHAAK